jgi:hypothetical protein
MDVRNIAAPTPLIPQKPAERAGFDVSISDRGVQDLPQSEAPSAPQRPQVASTAQTQALLSDEEAQALQHDFAFLGQARPEADSGRGNLYNGRGTRAHIGAVQSQRGSMLDLVG